MDLISGRSTVAIQSASASAVLDTLDDLFFTFNERGRFCWWNRAVNEVTGYDDEELASMGLADFFDDEDAERVTAAAAEVFKTGQGSVEASVVTSDGGRVPHEFRTVRIDEGSGFYGIGRDITDRRASAIGGPFSTG